MIAVLDRPYRSAAAPRNSLLSPLWAMPFFVLFVIVASVVWVEHEDYEALAHLTGQQ